MITKSLYQIKAEHQQVLDRLELAIGQDEISDEALKELNEALAINSTEFHAKAEAYCIVIGQKRARAEFLQSEAKRLTEMAKSEERHAEYLQSKISDAMQQQGLTKTNTAHYMLSFRKSATIEVSVPVGDLPVAYRRTKTVTEANKVALKDAIKKGESIPGVKLVERQNLQIH